MHNRRWSYFHKGTSIKPSPKPSKLNILKDFIKKRKPIKAVLVFDDCRELW
jgi:hypothetical protein